MVGGVDESSDACLLRLLLDPEFPWIKVRGGAGDYMVRLRDAVAGTADRWGRPDEAADALEQLVRANGGRRMKTTVVPITPGQIKRYITDKDARGNEYFRMPAHFFAAHNHHPAAGCS